MRTALGSQATEKVEILNKVLNDLAKDFEIIPVKVDPGIPDQPIGEEVIIKGARNRAREALQATNSDMSIGLEGGLVEENNVFSMLCVVVILDRNQKEYIGLSSKITIPSKVSEEIKKGGEFGRLIRSYRETVKDEEERELVDEIITREKAFTEAIRKGWREFSSAPAFIN